MIIALASFFLVVTPFLDGVRALPQCPLSIAFSRSSEKTARPGHVLKVLLKVSAQDDISGIGIQLAFGFNVSVEKPATRGDKWGATTPVLVDSKYLYWTDASLHQNKARRLKVTVRVAECTPSGPQEVTLMAYQIANGGTMAACLTLADPLQVSMVLPTY